MRRAAAIDVGTNSVRLLVADTTDTGIREIERDLVITRLGKGVDAARRFDDHALRRTVSAIAEYHRRARGAGADIVRIAATSAVRDSGDRERFVAAVRTETGVSPEVLSGEQEARLSFRGAVGGLEGPGPFLVLDVGGGSTEFVAGSRDVDAWTSLDVGSVRLTERYVRHDPPTAGELASIVADADLAVAEARRTVGGEGSTLVGLAGTITTVAAISLELEGYDRSRIHHAILSAGEIARIAEMLATMRTEQRRGLPVMPSGREDVIIAGAAIVRRVMDGFAFAELTVSESDLLDGLVLSIRGDAGMP